jgi:glycosyltransferase involved in cell wall biosynthesis
MVHLPALLGLARDVLAGTAVVAYFHENQLTYPLPEGAAPDETYAMTNWLTMAAADRVVFNSAYHRDDVLAALPGLLRRLPDHRHTDFVAGVASRVDVLPVGIDAARFAGPDGGGDGGPPVVLWNHRWEYDKDPEAFFGALAEVAAEGIDFRLVVAGERYQTVPPVFEKARHDFADRLLWFGTAPADEYPGLLRRADVVVSTARHEFFGVAVLEAVTAGALPLLPRRLSYPELVPAADPYLYDDDTTTGAGPTLVDRLRWALTDPPARRTAATAATAHAARFAWPNVAPDYDTLLTAVARRAGGTGRGRAPG